MRSRARREKAHHAEGLVAVAAGQLVALVLEVEVVEVAPWALVHVRHDARARRRTCARASPPPRVAAASPLPRC